MAKIDVLVAVRDDHATRFYKNLSTNDGLMIQIVTATNDALNVLADRDQHTDVLVVDNGLGEVYDMIGDLRQKYPRLLIILVDEDADFGMPGQADEFTNDPFRHDDLASKIKKLMSDRQLETIRSDSLPAVRNIAKRLRTATGRLGKQEAAVATCKDMGYDYVGYYHIMSTEPLKMDLKAQQGPNAILPVAPKQATGDDLMGWVVQNGQSRIAGPEDKPNHNLVARGRLGAVACIPVQFSGASYGALVVCNDRPNSMTQENVMMLELVAAQLAAALSKER